MVQDGELKGFHTPGGHVRIPVTSIETFRSGADELDTIETPSSVLQSRRDRIEELSLEAEELRAKRQLDAVRRDQAAEDAERAAAEDARKRRAQRDRDAQAAEVSRAQQQEERERERRRREEAVRNFTSRWVRLGNDELMRPEYRWLSESQKRSVCVAIEREVKNRDLSDEDRMSGIVTQVIVATVEPWDRLKKDKEQREHIADEAIRFLPNSATAEDRSRATVAVNNALAHTSPELRETELKAIVDVAISPIRKEIQRRETKEKAISWMLMDLPLGSTEQDRVTFRRNCHQILGALKGDISEEEARAALKRTLREACEKIDEREGVKQARRQKQGLVSFGMAEASTYLTILVVRGEVEYADVPEIKSDIQELLEEELSGEESTSEVRQLVRDSIDDW